MKVNQKALIVAACIGLLSACSGDGSTPYVEFAAPDNSVGVAGIEATATKSSTGQQTPLAVNNVNASTVTVTQ
ncbi:hypothetical protein [Litorivivens sp.]|uniref:hypothetical protein n=1 Tax=Litorivivens sp. TaxID=2020868 RepID=UPI0035622AE2